MAIFVDEEQPCVRNCMWRHDHVVHMISDDSSLNGTKDLIHFAELIGLKPSYIQKKRTYKEHFDLTRGKKLLAVANGAIAITSKELFLKMKIKLVIIEELNR